MTDTEINIAIAEACGWREILWSQLTNPREAIEQKHYCKSNALKTCGWLPSYTTDLNAMHEAEKTLDDNKWEQYWYALARITPGRPTSVCHATAAQRAEAFLKTIGKWKD